MTERLNVLLCVIDGARADYLSCYGHPRQTTPFLDEMAREGVRFPHMVASAPWTLPVLASLLTGKAVVAHGAHEEHRSLDAASKTLAEYLKTAGYRTAAFCTNPSVSPDSGFGRGFDVFFTQRYGNRLLTSAVSLARRVVDRLLRRTDAGARRSNRALKRWVGRSSAPFFALLHYNEAQIGADLPPPYDRMYLPRGVTPAVARKLVRGIAAGGSDATFDSRDHSDVLRARYEGALHYVDRRIREVADLLRQRGEWSHTLVVVTADHGIGLGEHGRVGHASGLHDELLRVPLLIRCPRVVPEGFVVEEIAQTTDVAPTILDLLAIQEDGERVQGRALLSGGRSSPGPAFAVAERFRGGGEIRCKAIRTKRDKFVWRSDEANEFYDLIADPGETQNLIEQEIERADLLRRQLFDWLAWVEGAAGDEAPSQAAGQGA